MNELKGQKIRIVLNLKQGRGFGHLGLENLQGISGIYIDSTLNSSSLATDIFPIVNEPLFDSELMWESDRKSLRRLRTDIATVKVQCFATDELQLKKERIGQFVINLRQAHIVPSGKPDVINDNWWIWHKLAGGKSPIPEVLCSLRLEERPQTPEPPNLAERSLIFGSDIQQAEKTQLPAIKYHSDSHVLQIGSDTSDLNSFILTIKCAAADNLELLLPGNLSKEQIKEQEVHFSYKILDYEIKSSTVNVQDVSKPYVEQIHEDVTITIHSSLQNLSQYLDKSSTLVVKLLTNKEKLASGELSLKALVPTTDLKKFCILSKENKIFIKEFCYLQESTGSNSTEGSRPSVRVVIALKYIGSKSESLQNTKYSTGSFTRDGRILGSPDQTNKNVDPSASLVCSDTYVQDDKDKGLIAQDAIKMVRSTTYTVFDKSTLEKGSSDPVQHCSIIRKDTYDDKSTQTPMEDPHHLYVLDIVLTDITLKEFPPHQIISFRFHHPKVNLIKDDNAEVSVSELNRETALHNISSKLKLVATPQSIGHLLKVHPPTISICCTVEGELQDLAHATLDTGPLLIDYKQKRSYYKTLLVDVNSMKEIGTVGVQLQLYDEGLYKETEEYPEEETISEKDLGPPILDDSVAYKIVEELEKWKEQQKMLYKKQLKEKEEVHLAALTAEWKKRRNELEANLIHKKEEFAKAAGNLRDATDEIRLNLYQHKEKEIELKKLKAMLFEKQKEKLKQLSEPFKTLEANFGSKMGIIDNNMQKLQENITKLEQENTKLRETIALQDEEIDSMRKTSLTTDQTASLLQELKSIEEKLENALKSKAFFKEQWGKAVREIHYIKSEHQKTIQAQVRKNLEALHKFGAQHLHSSGPHVEETQPLSSDLLTKINAMKMNNGIGDSNEHAREFVPTHHTMRGSHSMHSLRSTKPFCSASQDHTSIETRLKALVEERDILLKTGTYTLEDPVVCKLNNEIRSLLIHSNGVT